MTMGEGPETKNGFVNPEKYEQVEDTKGVIRIRKSKDRQYNGQRTDNTMAKGQKDKQLATKHYI